MLNTEVKNLYAKFRKDSPTLWTGRNAELALSQAKTLSVFRTLEDQGLVRITAEPEEESYFDVYGKPDNERERQSIVEALERDGCWYVQTEYFSPESEEWEHADSIGMCVYDDPTSPFENCYVIDLMREAIDKLTAETAEAD
jgi:hypothetical protein